jgi:hypothetical protein
MDTDSSFSPLFENKAALDGRGSSQSLPARASRLVLHASTFFDLLLLVYDLRNTYVVGKVKMNSKNRHMEKLKHLSLYRREKNVNQKRSF